MGALSLQSNLIYCSCRPCSSHLRMALNYIHALTSTVLCGCNGVCCLQTGRTPLRIMSVWRGNRHLLLHAATKDIEGLVSHPCVCLALNLALLYVDMLMDCCPFATDHCKLTYKVCKLGPRSGPPFPAKFRP
jgi:hypothetical protein